MCTSRLVEEFFINVQRMFLLHNGDLPYIEQIYNNGEPQLVGSEQLVCIGRKVKVYKAAFRHFTITWPNLFQLKQYAAKLAVLETVQSVKTLPKNKSGILSETDFRCPKSL